MFCRWCACSVCEQWRKWNGVMFKIVLSKHKDTCICTCVFCDSDCVSIERLSPRYIMEHLLCPGERQFALSSVILYNWDCINNRYCTLLISHLLSKLYGTCWCYVSRCNTCFRNRRGTLFACPRLNRCGINSSCKVSYCNVVQYIHLPSQTFPHFNPLTLSLISGVTLQSLPAAARRVKQWVKKKTTKQIFTALYLSKLPSFFLHRQIEQVLFPVFLFFYRCVQLNCHICC